MMFNNLSKWWCERYPIVISQNCIKSDNAIRIHRIYPNYSLTKRIIRKDIFRLFWTMQQTVNHPYTGFRKISCGEMLPRVFHYVHSNILQNYVQSFLPFICYLEILTNCNFNSYSSSRELKLLYQKMVPSALNSDSALKNILLQI